MLGKFLIGRQSWGILGNSLCWGSGECDYMRRWGLGGEYIEEVQLLVRWGGDGEWMGSYELGTWWGCGVIVAVGEFLLGKFYKVGWGGERRRREEEEEEEK